MSLDTVIWKTLRGYETIYEFSTDGRVRILNYDNEIWKDISGYETIYQASSHGRIRTLNYSHTGRTEVMTRYLHKTGYYQISIHRFPEKQRVILVQRLVAMAFHSIPYVNYRVYHINGIKTDNRPENLVVKQIKKQKKKHK